MKEPGKSRKTCKTCRFCRQMGRISMGRFDLGRFRPDPWFFCNIREPPISPKARCPLWQKGRPPVDLSPERFEAFEADIAFLKAFFEHL